MRITLHGGPYDGRRITSTALTRHATVLTLRSAPGQRRYLVMPAPRHWRRVVAGAMTAAASESQHFYEVVGTVEGVVLIYDPARAGYWSAVRRVVGELPGGKDRNGH